MGVLERWRRRSRAADLARAVPVGGEAEAKRAAERLAEQAVENARAAAERARAEQSAAEIADAVKKHGVWWPPSDRRGRW